MLNNNEFFDRKYKKQKTKMSYCFQCEKETKHLISEGNNGFDSWYEVDCIECLEFEEKGE